MAENKWVDSSIEEFNALVAQISKTLAEERQWRDNRIAELEVELESRENIIRDIMLEKSHLWADNQFLEAQCAALREVLSSAAYYYEPATTILAQLDAGAALLKRLQAAEAVCETFYSDYFEAINIEEDEEDFPDWCVAYRKWRELKTGECAIHMEKCDCKKPPGALS